MLKDTGLLIGVIADTHGYLPPEAEHCLADCAHIIHAGDIGSLQVLRDLKAIAPTTAVLGNNDRDEYGKSVLPVAHLELVGVRFFITHYPQRAHLVGSALRAFGPGRPLPHICIHGHTHVPKITRGKEAGAAQMVVCPGSVTSPRQGSKPSIAKIRLVHRRIGDVYIEEIG
jgi:putative phosphoesterase